MIGSPLDELDNLVSDFVGEPKNYHAWQYRQWILQTFPEAGSVVDEMRFLDELLRVDMYNNSAWNHRYFVYSRFEASPDWKGRERLFTKGKLEFDLTNESAIQYLNWIDRVE